MYGTAHHDDQSGDYSTDDRHGYGYDQTASSLS